MDLVITPVVEVVKCIMTPTCSHVEHHRLLGERMKELTEKLTELKCRKEDIERMKQTEVGSDQETKKEVEHWLERAESITTEIQEVEQKSQNVKYICRGRFSKRVLKKIVEVDKILEKEFPSIAVDKLQPPGMVLPTDRNAEGDQNSVKFRQQLEEKIMEYLMGDDVAMVGVCGKGGVGKTTLAKSINNKLSSLKDSKFDKVIWAPIPYPFSIVKLQENIADAMKEKLSENGNEEVRAAKLIQILGRLKFVLILDDAWERFSFDDVGIPVPTVENGCKVVITSRKTQLCKQIGCKDDGIVDVETLSDEESYDLFLDTVGRDVILKVPNIEATLRGLVKGCAGLPLAIVVIARSMRGEYDISEWRNALNELSTRVESVRGWDDEMFERLKFSYDRLKEEEFQNCFLFCSLYGKSEKIPKEGLMQRWIDGGLIKQVKTRKEMADRGRAILKRLISDCLIEEAGEDWRGEWVRMHDVMRDMALRVAGSRFMVKAGEKVRCITENGEWTEHLEKVSMIEGGLSEISPDFCPKCPKLSALLLSRNYDLKMIPDSFFKGMPSLEYLDLSKTRISALPDSVSDLINLTTLLLRGIEELKYVPSLAGLKALKKLDLCGAGIEVVPEGIEALVNLQYLDLLCPDLVEFPMRILKDLSRLETLAANFSSCWSKTDFVADAKQILARLSLLEAFIGNFDNLEGLNNYVKLFHELQKPTRYLLTVGAGGLESLIYDLEYSSFNETIECSRKVVIWGSEIQEKHAVLLPNDLQQLEIMDCRGVGSLSETSLPDTETDFRSCEIWECSFEYILDLGLPSSSICRLFDKCEVLNLTNMDELRALIKGAPQATSAMSTSSHASLSSPPSIFSNIKRFEMGYCPRIKKLFPSDLLKGLPNLEEILVSNCKRIEEIIESEGEEKETVLTGGKNETTVTFNLVKLRKLVLEDLPKLKRICAANGVMVCDSIETIDISECPKLHRIPLRLPLSSPPPSLQEIKLDSRGMWDALEWVNPTTKEILLPFFKPHSDARYLTWEFDGLQDFNSFLKRFQDDNLTGYEFTVKPIDDDDDHSGSKSSGDKDDDDEEDSGSKSSDDKDDDDEEDSGSKSSDDQDDYEDDYYENIVEIERDLLKIVALHGVQINVDQAVLLPNDVQCLEIKKCGGMKSLCELKTEAKNLASCVVKQCGELECMLPSSSVCSLLDNGLQSLMLRKLPKLQVLVRMENQAIPTPPSIFCNLKHFVVWECPRIKKLFPSELLIGLQNLEKIWVFDCAEMEEIIKVGEEEGEKETITFTLPKLKDLRLWKLPKLKRICPARGVMVCDSLEEIGIGQCEMLTRIPLDLPLLPDGQLSAPPSLKEIATDSNEWWESLEWDKPAAKDILAPFLKVEESDE